LAERVYKAFKRDVVEGVLAPGAVVSEKELAARYQVSRTPIREAAVRLQHERLLHIVPNRGYFVTQITLHEMNDIYEYRLAVECACAGLAARKGGPAGVIERLFELARTRFEVDNCQSYSRFVEADTDLHIGIAQLSGNQILVRAVSEARCHMERIMHAAVEIGYYGEVPIAEHLGIVEAIQQRDPEAARKRMFEHIARSREKVLRLTVTVPRGNVHDSGSLTSLSSTP
jgi:DNA-binding GntR family transcriptional regulator